LRKSFHFIPLRVPADWAAWYLALHSFIVSACAGRPPHAAAAKKTLVYTIDRVNMAISSNVWLCTSFAVPMKQPACEKFHPLKASVKFELLTNLKAAKAIGLTIAPALLRRADELIE